MGVHLKMPHVVYDSYVFVCLIPVNFIKLQSICSIGTTLINKNTIYTRYKVTFMCLSDNKDGCCVYFSDTSWQPVYGCKQMKRKI